MHEFVNTTRRFTNKYSTRWQSLSSNALSFFFPTRNKSHLAKCSSVSKRGKAHARLIIHLQRKLNLRFVPLLGLDKTRILHLAFGFDQRAMHSSIHSMILSLLCSCAQGCPSRPWRERRTSVRASSFGTENCKRNNAKTVAALRSRPDLQCTYRHVPEVVRSVANLVKGSRKVVRLPL